MPAYKVEIQEVIERSGIVSAASKDEVEGSLEKLRYALANEDVQCVEREVVSVVELTPADLGAGHVMLGRAMASGPYPWARPSCGTRRSGNWSSWVRTTSREGRRSSIGCIP